MAFAVDWTRTTSNPKRKAAGAGIRRPLLFSHKPQKQVNESIRSRLIPEYIQKKPFQRKPDTEVLPTNVG